MKLRDELSEYIQTLGEKCGNSLDGFQVASRQCTIMVTRIISSQAIANLRDLAFGKYRRYRVGMKR